MTSCSHSTLTLLPQQKNRLRCRHCHLTIKKEDLAQDFCPECYEMQGEKRNDFEEVECPDAAETRYRCETCGAIIKGD
jgi:Zn finger protein HypA/HybF involved in hydrogenase expression